MDTATGIQNSKEVVILIADDDEEDCMLTRNALAASHLVNRVETVHNGEELLCYLHAVNEKNGSESLPGLILLDLNMPRKDGREALAEIKGHSVFRRIPVIILTTSDADEDIVKTYDLGVNSYITKPVTFEKLVEKMQSMSQYWFQIVTRPQL